MRNQLFHPDVSEHLQKLPLAVSLCITGAHAFVVGESLSFMSHSLALCLAETFLIIFPEAYDESMSL